MHICTFSRHYLRSFSIDIFIHLTCSFSLSRAFCTRFFLPVPGHFPPFSSADVSSCYHCCSASPVWALQFKTINMPNTINRQVVISYLSWLLTMHANPNRIRSTHHALRAVFFHRHAVEKNREMCFSHLPWFALVSSQKRMKTKQMRLKRQLYLDKACASNDSMIQRRKIDPHSTNRRCLW